MPPAAETSSRHSTHRHNIPTWGRLLVCATTGVVVAVGVWLLGALPYGVLLGWAAAAGVFIVWTWSSIWPMDSEATRTHAVREDSGRAVTDVIILAAALASLAAVVLFLLSGSSSGGGKDIQAALSVAAVAAAWGSVHTLFTTRYARLYYQAPRGAVNFNEDDAPRYSDFAYLAFTIGMTFQVSDTALRTKEIHAMALRHALLSYVLGVGVIAVTINLIAGLGK